MILCKFNKKSIIKKRERERVRVFAIVTSI